MRREAVRQERGREEGKYGGGEEMEEGEGREGKERREKRERGKK